MLISDLNCDMGEGIGNDELILPYITSANIACGYHAGSPEIMKRLVDLCLEYEVSIGAHPSYPDRQNFGRRDLIDVYLKPEDLPKIIIDQLQLLNTICLEAGTKMNHVKPHGALYNRASWDGVVASFICKSLLEFDPSLILFGLSNSEMKREAEGYGLSFRNEVFADRTYQEDGSLTPRSRADALIMDKESCIRQVLQMVDQKTVTTTSGKVIPVIVDTICIHGDGQHAVEFARAINMQLNKGKNI